MEEECPEMEEGGPETEEGGPELEEGGLELEEESPELKGVGDDTILVFVDNDDEIEEPPKVEVGGEVDVTGGRVGIEVVLFRQVSDWPGSTVITGVALPSPLESPRTITTFVPAGIVTKPQVNEVPVTLVKAAMMGPSALVVWKERLNGAEMPCGEQIGSK